LLGPVKNDNIKNHCRGDGRTVGILKDALLFFETAAFTCATACGIGWRDTASPCYY